MKTASRYAKYASIWISINLALGAVGGITYALVTHPLHFQPWVQMLKYFWSQL